MPSLKRLVSRTTTAAVAAALLGAALTPMLFAGAQDAQDAQTLASSQTPFTDSPLGPVENVTSDWAYYQPASDFCITPDVFEVPSFSGTPCSVAVGGAGSSVASSSAGSTTPGTETNGTYEVKIDTPALCATCVRLFIDYSKIGVNEGTTEYAHGHAYFRLLSFNVTYTSDPVAHSPNIKNLTNDYLIAPPGSASSTVTGSLDPHLLTYVADTVNYAHNDTQGPYYIGPGYYNTEGTWIDGSYVDIDLANATETGTAALDEVTYGAVFDANSPSCLDSEVGGPTYSDGNYFYAGCVDWGGGDPTGVSPWPDGQ